MIPEGDPDLTSYFKELLGTNKPDWQNNTVPTAENPRKNEEHTPIQTRILIERTELKQNENLSPTDIAES